MLWKAHIKNKGQFSLLIECTGKLIPKAITEHDTGTRYIYILMEQQLVAPYGSKCFQTVSRWHWCTLCQTHVLSIAPKKVNLSSFKSFVQGFFSLSWNHMTSFPMGNSKKATMQRATDFYQPQWNSFTSVLLKQWQSEWMEELAVCSA